MTNNDDDDGGCNGGEEEKIDIEIAIVEMILLC
jgi:hypothetical protein